MVALGKVVNPNLLISLQLYLLSIISTIILTFFSITTTAMISTSVRKGGLMTKAQRFHLHSSSSRYYASSISIGTSTTFCSYGHHNSGKLGPFFRMRRTAIPSSASSLSTSTLPHTQSSSIFDPYRNPNNVNDIVVAALSPCGGCKITACTVRNLMNEMISSHSMNSVPADVLGRLVVCSLLISNGMQYDQTLQISVDSDDGPLQGAMVVCSGGGTQVRGYVGNPSLNGFTRSEAVGKSGTVQIVKNHPSWPNPYNGITRLQTGDIDIDVGIYLAESEQRSCALAAATVITSDTVLCRAAGGYLVERLPGCSEEAIRTVEQNLAALLKNDEDALSNLLLQGVTPLELIFQIFHGMSDDNTVIPLGYVSPSFLCPCTEDRLLRSLRLLPPSEVEEIIAKHDAIEARCHFCGKLYRLEPDEVRQKFALAKGDPSKDVDL
jgi:molecular chaperone Hsp33